MVSEALYLAGTTADLRDSGDSVELSGYVPRSGTGGRGAEDCHL
jgi:hypothetical protein